MSFSIMVSSGYTASSGIAGSYGSFIASFLRNLSKRKQIKSADEDVENREFYYTVAGNVNWYSHYGKQYWGSSQNKK